MIRALSKVQQKVNFAYRLASAGRVAPQASRCFHYFVFLVISTRTLSANCRESVETEQINDSQALQETARSARGICSSLRMNSTTETASAAHATPEVGGGNRGDQVDLILAKLHSCEVAPPSIHTPLYTWQLMSLFE